MNKQTQFHEKNLRFVVSKFVKQSYVVYCISLLDIYFLRRRTVLRRNDEIPL